MKANEVASSPDQGSCQDSSNRADDFTEGSCAFFPGISADKFCFADFVLRYMAAQTMN
jgi:hypothetical protein